jgi:membrane protein required for colicin V production
VFSAIGGLRKGLVREALGLAALVVGLLCGLWFYGLGAAFVQPVVRSKPAANVIGFFLIVGAVVVAGFLVTLLIEKLLKLIHLSWLNRLLGGVFGLLRGALISALIILAMMAFTSKPPPRSVVESRLAPYVIETARVIAALAPHELKEGFRQSYEKVIEIWDKTMIKGPRKPPSQEI